MQPFSERLKIYGNKNKKYIVVFRDIREIRLWYVISTFKKFHTDSMSFKDAILLYKLLNKNEIKP